jgi:antitoxin component YwqK of YwqJK toxin-antitoxin module
MKQTLLIITALMLMLGCSKVEGKQDLIPVVETYDNGMVKEIKYHKKTRDGIELVKGETYYSSGQKESEGTYKNAKQDGKWTSWHNNGQKYIEETYKDGVLDGLWTWYDNGQKRKEGTYKGVDRWGDPVENGKWTFWYENGQKWREETYKDGKIIRTTWWDKDGNESGPPSLNWE